MVCVHSRCLAVCVLALLGSSSAPARGACRAWPGEPEPLPQVGAADEFAAGWALMRREELRGLALLLETTDPVEARRLWLHTACLAPGDAEVSAALARIALPVVHRVAVRAAPLAAATRRATLGAAFDVLDSEARVPTSAPKPPGGSEPVGIAEFHPAPVDAQIATAAQHLDQARFQAAADLSDLARARLVRFATTPAVRERRMRIEVLGATARLALGQEEDARRCVERALREQPDLALDPASSPPKLQRLLKETRERLVERER